MAPEFGKPIHQLPLIPANILEKHRVHEPPDPRFRSAARLLQALWCEDRPPIGSYVSEDLFRCSDVQGRNGFVAFEIKYSESMREPMPELKPNVPVEVAAKRGGAGTIGRTGPKRWTDRGTGLRCEQIEGERARCGASAGT